MAFTNEQMERYSRHIILQEVGVKGQKKLMNGKVLIIGAGGLGAPAAMYLAAAGVLIVDIRHKPTENELVMHDWFRQSGCPEIVVANKLDKLKKSQVEPALTLIRETLALTEQDILIPFSAEKGEGKDTLVRLLLDACQG